MGRKDRILAHYEPRIAAGGSNAEILDWACPDEQRARFAALADNVALADRRLLDVGCGLGHRRAPARHTGYVYYEPSEVTAGLGSLSCSIRLVDDYLPGDFTLICRKDGAA